MSKVAENPPALDEKHTKDIVEVGLILTAGLAKPIYQAALVNTVVATRQWKSEAGRWSSLRYIRHRTYGEAYDTFLKIARTQTRSGATESTVIFPVPLQSSEARAGRNGWIPKWIFEHGVEVHEWSLTRKEDPVPELKLDRTDPVVAVSTSVEPDPEDDDDSVSATAAALGDAFKAAFGDDD